MRQPAKQSGTKLSGSLKTTRTAAAPHPPG